MTSPPGCAMVMRMSHPSRPLDVVRESGLRLLVTRCALGIPQQRFAELLEVSPQRLSNWERQEHLPDVLAMRRLKPLFSVRLDWIFDGDLTAMPIELAMEIRRRRPDLIRGAPPDAKPSPDWDVLAGEERRA